MHLPYLPLTPGQVLSAAPPVPFLGHLSLSHLSWGVPDPHDMYFFESHDVLGLVNIQKANWKMTQSK